MKKLKSLLALFATCLFLTACGTGCDNGSGDKVGFVQKINVQGIWCKTYEVDVQLSGNNMAATVEQYTVLDKSLIPELEALAESGEKVKLHTQLAAFTGPCTTEPGSHGFITGVTKLQKNPVNVNIEDEKDKGASKAPSSAQEVHGLTGDISANTPEAQMLRCLELGGAVTDCKKSLRSEEVAVAQCLKSGKKLAQCLN